MTLLSANQIAYIFRANDNVSYRAVSYKMKLRVHYLFSTIKYA